MFTLISPPAYKPYLPDGRISSWDGRNVVLTEEFRYVDDVLGERFIPKGFVTDGGSIPEPFQNIIKPFGHGLWGFLPHDLEYGLQRITRLQADQMLKRILDQTGFNLIGTGVVYDAVRIFGESAWKEDSKRVAANLALLGGDDGRPTAAAAG